MGLAHPKHWRDPSAKFHPLQQSIRKRELLNMVFGKKMFAWAKQHIFFPEAESSVTKMVGLFITLSAVATPHGKFQSEWLKSGKVSSS